MTSLYQRILGDRFGQLPRAVQQLHCVETDVRYSGRCEVKRGRGWLAQRCADLLSLPRAGANVEVTVHLARQDEREIWTRHFAGRRFRSVQWQVGEHLQERVRFSTLVFAVSADAEGLSLDLRQVYVLGLPALGLLRPRVLARETQRDGDFHFHVRGALAGIGLIVEYQGTLKPDA
jgi:hypothetical protein